MRRRQFFVLSAFLVPLLGAVEAAALNAKLSNGVTLQTVHPAGATPALGYSSVHDPVTLTHTTLSHHRYLDSLRAGWRR